MKARRRRIVKVVVWNLVVLLVLLGCWELGLRLSEPDIGIRYGVIAVTSAFWILYFGFGGRARKAS